MLQQKRVLGFLPTINGLHFPNHWPPVPDFKINVFGQAVNIGDASNGLCGGMVFTVKDLFESGFLPPVDTTNPAEGTPFYNYIVARLIHSINWDNTNQYLSWIQMSNHDTWLSHGLAWHEITEEWPKIKADLDSDHVSPLALVHGQEPAGIGYITALQDIGDGHVVLAWGYDLNDSQLTIYIYDPNCPTHDDCTISLDIASPSHTTDLQISHYLSGQFRGFFRYHYEYHNPTAPVSAAIVAGVVSSPGITPAGPLVTAESVVAIESIAFPGVYLRMDGQGVTQPTAAGGGRVNCQYTSGPWEKFRLVPQGEDVVAIESTAFPSVYLRMDGQGVSNPTAAGGGRVNCQYTSGPWEKFRLVPQGGDVVAIESIAFPGVYLRMDGQGVTQPTAAGGGTVNCQYTSGPWEKFRLVPLN